MTAPDELPSELDPLLREALAWVIRLHSGAATGEDADAVQRWRCESPEREQAFRDAVKLWRTFGDATRTLVVPVKKPESRGRLTRSARNLVNRRSLIGGAIAASAAAYFVVRPPFGLWPSLEELQADYRTAKGEQRNIALSDTISLKLNTQTSIVVRSTKDQPRIELISGEAAVVSDRAGRTPLVIDAATGRVTAFQASFNVRCVGDAVSVSCIDKVVSVECDGRGVQISKEQQVSYSAARGLGTPLAVDLVQARAWQDGLLIVHDWSLNRVVDEINRYRPGKIVVMDAKLGGRMITGTFHLDHLDDFIGQAHALFGATVRSLPGGVVLLS